MTRIGNMLKTCIQHHLQIGQVVAHDAMVHCCRQSLQTMLHELIMDTSFATDQCCIDYNVLCANSTQGQYVNCDTLPKQVM